MTEMALRPAPTDHPIHELLAGRWSARSQTGAPISAAEAARLFEAARWAPSCNNDQPWHFLAARRDADPDGFARLLSLLNPGNQAWAKGAAMIVVTVARLDFRATGKPNPTAYYDLGAAASHLVLQAAAMGLAARQMRGFDVERARAELGIPQGHDPVSCIAIGRPAPASALPEGLVEKETAPRTRHAQGEFVHGAGWSAKLSA